MYYALKQYNKSLHKKMPLSDGIFLCEYGIICNVPEAAKATTNEIKP